MICTSPPRAYRGLPDGQFPLHDHTVTVSVCGRICFGTKKINLSQVLAGPKVGIKEEEDGIWPVSFMHYEIGDFDLELCRVEPVDKPFGPKVLAMSSV
ncbi:transposase (fragment) [Burkholderiales bacterium]